MKYFLLTLIFSLFIIACGDKFSRKKSNGFTEVFFEPKRALARNMLQEFTNGQLSLQTFSAEEMIPGGKVMVYAMDVDNPNSRGRHVYTSTAIASTVGWTLPNATYKFGVIAYDSGTGDFGAGGAPATTPYCGGSANTTLNSNPINITVNTTTGTGWACDNPPFANSGEAITGAGTLTMHICTGTITGATFGSGSCAGAGATADTSTVLALRVHADSFDMFSSQMNMPGPGSVPDAAGPCNTVSTGMATLQKLVQSKTGIPEYFPIEVTAYSDGACTTASSLFTLVFKKGLVAVTGTGSGTIDHYLHPSGPVTDWSTKAIYTVSTTSSKLWIQE